MIQLRLRVFAATAAVLVVLCGVPVRAATVKWGPVMGLVTPRTAEITWRTSGPARCRLLLKGGSPADVRSADVYHAASLEHLTPATASEYTIEVEDSQGITRCGPFQVRTPPGDPAEWSFVVYGDTRGNTADPNSCSNHGDHLQVVKAMERVTPPPVFYTNTGDLVDRGERTDNWDKFFEIESPLLLKVPFLPVRGNHDHDPGLFGGIFPSLIDLNGQKVSWRSFRFANAQFVMLDTGWDGKNDVAVCTQKLASQMPLLEKTLEQATQDGIRWKFVFCHIPPFTSGRYGCNSDLAKTLVPVLEKHKVTCCFSAHCHLYERSFKSGVIYLVSGGGGSPFQEPPGTKPNPYSVQGAQSRHFLVVRVCADRVETEVFSPEGETLDSFSDRTGGQGHSTSFWVPPEPTAKDVISIRCARRAKLHWGVNGWTLPPQALWPAGSQAWPDGKAIETPMGEGKGKKGFVVNLGPFENQQPPVREIDAVFHYEDDTWGKDFKIPIK